MVLALAHALAVIPSAAEESRETQPHPHRPNLPTPTARGPSPKTIRPHQPQPTKKPVILSAAKDPCIGPCPCPCPALAVIPSAAEESRETQPDPNRPNFPTPTARGPAPKPSAHNNLNPPKNCHPERSRRICVYPADTPPAEDRLSGASRPRVSKIERGFSPASKPKIERGFSPASKDKTSQLPLCRRPECRRSRNDPEPAPTAQFNKKTSKTPAKSLVKAQIA